MSEVGSQDTAENKNQFQHIQEEVTKRGGDFKQAKVINPYLLQISKKGIFGKTEHHLIQSSIGIFKIEINPKGLSLTAKKEIEPWHSSIKKTGLENEGLILKSVSTDDVTIGHRKGHEIEILEIRGIKPISEDSEISFDVGNNSRLHLIQNQDNPMFISFKLKTSSKS